MAAFDSQVNVKSAQVKSSKFDFSGVTVSSSDFFKPFPTRSFPLYPNDRVYVKNESFVRLHPLAVPTFGRVDMINRWFFVPFRSVFQAWNNFMERRPFAGSMYDKVILMTNAQLHKVFYHDISNPSGEPSVGDTGAYASIVSLDPTGSLRSTGADFGNYNSVYQTNVWYKLTTRGRHLLQILHGLGYSVNFTQLDQRSLSAIPLLCYMRVICDYYTDPQEASSFEYLFTHSSGVPLSDNDLRTLCNHITSTNYDFDYFTSAWVHPEQPNGGTYNINGISIVDNTATPFSTPGSSNAYNIIGTPNGQSAPGGKDFAPAIRSTSNPDATNITYTDIRHISHFALDALRAISNYTRRHNLVGWRLMDRFLADFGKKLDYKEANQSLFICSKSVPIQISDVTSTADTTDQSSGKILGAYAGKGIGYGDVDFDFSPDSQHGMLVCISSIVPKTSYYQGSVKQQGVLAMQNLDFFSGDFEHLGTQAIQLQELFSDMHTDGEWETSWHNNYDPKRVFGWQPRYSEWKSGYDTLSGDFRVPHLSSGADSFHLFRTILPLGGGYDVNDTYYQNLVKISPQFRKGDQSQYDRIFSYQSSDTDHFMCFFNFKIDLYRNASSISDTLLETLPTQQDDVQIHRDGQLFN